MRQKVAAVTVLILITSACAPRPPSSDTPPSQPAAEVKSEAEIRQKALKEQEAAREKQALDELRARLAQPPQGGAGFDDPKAARAWLTSMSGRLQGYAPKAFPDAKQRLAFLRMVHAEATRAGISPELALAVIDVKSGFDRLALAPSGAAGYMQIEPKWVTEIGQDGDNLFDARTNLRMGCNILRYYLDLEHDPRQALARYDGSDGKPDFPYALANALGERWAPEDDAQWRRVLDPLNAPVAGENVCAREDVQKYLIDKYNSADQLGGKRPLRSISSATTVFRSHGLLGCRGLYTFADGGAEHMTFNTSSPIDPNPYAPHPRVEDGQNQGCRPEDPGRMTFAGYVPPMVYRSLGECQDQLARRPNIPGQMWYECFGKDDWAPAN